MAQEQEPTKTAETPRAEPRPEPLHGWQEPHGESKPRPRRPLAGLKGGLAVIAACVLTSAATIGGLMAFGFIEPASDNGVSPANEKIVLQEGEAVADIFNTVSPSTVAVSTRTTSDTGPSRFYPDDYTTEGAGSGIIISKDGYVMTNKHVVPEGSTTVTVTTSDGKDYTDVDIIGRDPVNDVAFLKIKGVDNLQAARLGDSSGVEPGEKVIAIGNALGEFRNSVTSGIISGLGRPIQASDETGQGAETLENLFQTDAAINPGNSGGPLVNYKGEVIGMNTAVAAGAQGIGFAIPINDVKGMVKSVVETGKIVRPYLGVRYVTLDKVAQQQFKLSVNHGAYVIGDGQNRAVLPGSPAAKADLREGDIVTKVNGRTVDTSHSLASQLAQFQPGDKVELTILRDGKERTVEVTLEAYPQ